VKSTFFDAKPVSVLKKYRDPGFGIPILPNPNEDYKFGTKVMVNPSQYPVFAIFELEF
jgi:hypothetical protein